MKRVYTYILWAGLACVTAIAYAGNSAYAQVEPGEIPSIYLEGNIRDQVTVSSWVDFFITGVKWFYTILFIIAVLYILISAFTFITSGGDQEKVKKAKGQLLYAIIGIAVAFLSYSFISLVRNTLG